MEECVCVTPVFFFVWCTFTVSLGILWLLASLSGQSASEKQEELVTPPVNLTTHPSALFHCWCYLVGQSSPLGRQSPKQTKATAWVSFHMDIFNPQRKGNTVTISSLWA